MMCYHPWKRQPVIGVGVGIWSPNGSAGTVRKILTANHVLGMQQINPRAFIAQPDKFSTQYTFTPKCLAGNSKGHWLSALRNSATRYGVVLFSSDLLSGLSFFLPHQRRKRPWRWAAPPGPALLLPRSRH
jgi:hypothetical protein